MLDFSHQINQKRGIALIKFNGKEQFSDKDYFGYDDFSVKKIKRENLNTISDLKELGECVTENMSIGALLESIEILYDEALEEL